MIIIPPDNGIIFYTFNQNKCMPIYMYKYINDSIV